MMENVSDRIRHSYIYQEMIYTVWHIRWHNIGSWSRDTEMQSFHGPFGHQLCSQRDHMAVSLNLLP